MLTVYEWIDSIPLSREKKNIARDFCDGLLVAEIIKSYKPKLVELHNYPSASSTKQKLSNWNTLCLKVFKKIKMSITQEEIENVINSKPKAIEKVLFRLYNILVKHDPTGGMIKENVSSVIEEDEEKLKEEINKLDHEISDLNNKKDVLQEEIKVKEEETATLEIQYQELLKRVEYKSKKF